MDSDADPSLKAFFTEWQTYRLFKDANFLHHREVAEILHRELARRVEPFSFLDLASGDASASSEFLRGTKVASYTAVDFSRPALDLARENTASLACPRNFLERDFADFAETAEARFDIIYLGLSLHHHATERKRQIVSALHSRVAPGGSLFLFEPILAPGESREDLMPRWKKYLDEFPAPLPAEARETIWRHVRSCDFPESLEEYESAARTAGFQRTACLFTDRHALYSLLEARRDPES
jgi:SAM-dependent methyltransferase